MASYKTIACGFIVSMISIFHTPAVAQNCEPLLRFGIFDNQLTTDSSLASNLYRSNFCGSATENRQSQYGGGLSFIVPQVPVPLGFNFNSSNQAQSASNVCSAVDVSSLTVSQYMNWSRQASPVLARAFNDCQASQGLHGWIERTSTPEVFRLKLRLKIDTPRLLPPARVNVAFTPPQNVRSCRTFVPSAAPHELILENHILTDLTCTLNHPAIGVVITLNSSNYSPVSGNLEIPPANPLPIILHYNNTFSSNAVRPPRPGDQGSEEGSDFLADAWNGRSAIVSNGGRPRSVTWRAVAVLPGLYARQ